MISEADYQQIKARLAAETVSVKVLHVQGDIDAQHVIQRVAPLNVPYGGTSVGTGASATLGKIGGSGPTAAAQFQWIKVSVLGTTGWIPEWH